MLDRRQLLTRLARTGLAGPALSGTLGGTLGSTVFAGLLMPRHALAQTAPAAAPPRATPAGGTLLSEGLWLITSGGSNVLALTTANGLVLVDSGAPDRTDALLASLAALPGGGRVRTLFNTHYHLENTGANERLAQQGVTIVAHENTRLWMATPVWNPAEDRYRQPRPKPAQPTQTFRSTGSMAAGSERLDHGYLIEAHTSGDIYVHFRAANVLAAGDVVSPLRDPALDYFTGAWIGGRVDALDRLLALCDDRTRVVPGVGPVMTRPEVQAERDVMKIVYDRTVDRVREGDEATDMLEAGVLEGLARTWQDPRQFLYDVQKGLWAHHNKLSPNVV